MGTRANLLIGAVVLTDEVAAVYGKFLSILPDGRREELYYESYVQDCRERRATAASVFQMNNSGFHAEITLEKENLVFFSVPYDDGFTAYVNGQEADIVEVDEGLMAVLCPAGENSIDFVYQPDGIRLSRPLTFGGIGVFAIPQMGRFYRHVLIEKNFPHHGAVAFGHYGKAIFDVLRCLGVTDVGFNQPQGMLYPTENPFA